MAHILNEANLSYNNKFVLDPRQTFHIHDEYEILSKKTVVTRGTMA